MREIEGKIGKKEPDGKLDGSPIDVELRVDSAFFFFDNGEERENVLFWGRYHAKLLTFTG